MLIGTFEIKLIKLKDCLMTRPATSTFPSRNKKKTRLVVRSTSNYNHFGTGKAEVLNSLIMNITAKANDTNDILQTFR